MLLTPHLTKPAEGKAYPDDIGIMKAGIYNLGFLGVSNCEEAEEILQWWARRLSYQCINAQNEGIFVDQKFMDLVPGFAANARVLRDTNLNIAYWNLAQRSLSQETFGWAVDGKPLGFFHFSGFDCKNASMLSKHTSAFRGDAVSPELRILMEEYAANLNSVASGMAPLPDYAFGRFKSGTAISPIVREMFRTRHATWPANPFETLRTTSMSWSANGRGSMTVWSRT